MSVELTFGALADPIGYQLERQGLALPDAERDRLQPLADAITRLSLHAILTDAEMARARRRLAKRVLSVVERPTSVEVAP